MSQTMRRPIVYRARRGKSNFCWRWMKNCVWDKLKREDSETGVSEESNQFVTSVGKEVPPL